MRYLKLTLGIMVTTAMVTATQAANVIEHRYKEVKYNYLLLGLPREFSVASKFKYSNYRC
jgi:hypothetical protein